MLAANGKTLLDGAYNCRFARECGLYNPALNVPVVLTVRGQRVGAHEKANHCTHGGGGCETYAHKIDEAIFTRGGLR